MNKINFINYSAALVDTTLFFTASYLASQTSTFHWLKDSIRAEGLAIYAIINALSIAALNKLSMKRGENTPSSLCRATFYQIGIGFAGCAIGTCLIEALTKLLSTQMGISPQVYGTAQIAALHFACKIGCTLATHLHHVYSSRQRPNLHTATINELSDAQITNCHATFTSSPQDLSKEQFQAFAARFFSLDLPPPSPKFTCPLDIPEDPDSISKNQSAYYWNLYLGEFVQKGYENHTLNDRIILYIIFNKHRAIQIRHFSPKNKEIPTLSKAALNFYRARYEEQKCLWKGKEKDFRETFQAALERHSLPPLPAIT